MVAAQTSRKEPAPAAKADGKRARILAAALDLFEARGFDGVAVPEIAARASVATGTIYRYFEDKEALVNALYRHWKQVYNEMVLAPVEEDLSPQGLFFAHWHRMTQFARIYPKAMRFLELHHHGAYLDGESRAAEREYLYFAQDFAAEAGATGAIRPLEPAMVVALMWGAAAGLAKFAGEGGLAFDAENAAQMGEAVWRAIAIDNAQPGG